MKKNPFTTSTTTNSITNNLDKMMKIIIIITCIRIRYCEMILKNVLKDYYVDKTNNNDIGIKTVMLKILKFRIDLFKIISITLPVKVRW